MRSPYHPVWPALALQMGVLFAVTAAIWFVGTFLRPALPTGVNTAINMLLVLLPLGSWGLFSLLGERRAALPRAGLVMAVGLSALLANAVGVPLMNTLFQLDRWLPLEGTTDRILGYTFSVGITHELIKYLLLRVFAWERIGTREDALAYALAISIGYTLVLNAHFLLDSPAPPQWIVTAATVFGNVALSTAAAIITSYGLAEMRLSRPSPFLMTATLALAALLQGALTTFRLSLGNAAFSITGRGGVPSYLTSIALSAGVILAVGLLFVFFYRTAERREREAAQEEG